MTATTVSRLLAEAAQISPGREFLRDVRSSVSFGEAYAFVRERGSRMRALFGENAAVVIFMPNGVEWPLTWLALLEAGLTAVPTNTAYADADLRHVIMDSGAQAVVTTGRHIERLRALVNDMPTAVMVVQTDGPEFAAADEPSGATPAAILRPSTVANLQYTSGTTGLPKACVLTHRYWAELGATMGRLYRLSGDDVAITAQPFSYVDPQWNVVMCLQARIPLVILDRFSASGFWRDVREQGATVFYVLGSMPLLLFKQAPHPSDRSNRVRLVLCSAIPADLHRQLEDRWGAPWREVYGLTEVGACTWVPPERTDLVGSGSIGYALGGHHVRLVKEAGEAVGELVVRTPSMMTGYHRAPQATSDVLSDGWFHTGDLGTFDPHTGFRLVGRKKDMIRRGGENVACTEVEEALNLDDSVLISAVIPEHDEVLGEEVKAFILPAPGATPGPRLALKLDEHMRSMLAGFKVPRYYEFVTAFPLTPSERVKKSELATQPPGTVYEFSKRARRVHE